jgi:molybdate transport system permease protein
MGVEQTTAGRAPTVGLPHTAPRPPIMATVGRTSARRRPSVGTPLLVLAAALMVLLIALPILAIFVRALPSGLVAEAIGRPVVLEALRLSGLTTFLTLTLALILGTPIAYILARREFPGRTLLDSLIELPMVLPPAVAGIGLLMAFGRRGLLGPFLGSLGISLGFTTVAVVLAQLFVATPFYIRAARSGFLGVDRELEDAARTMGASELQTFRYVTVPSALPSLLAGVVMCWARALGEFGATIMFAGSFQGRTQTMPLAIYGALESDLDAALVISAILVVASFAVLAALRFALKRTTDVEA